MSIETHIQLALLIPIIGLVGIVLTGRIPNLREAATLVTATANAINVWSIFPAIQAGARSGPRRRSVSFSKSCRASERRPAA